MPFVLDASMTLAWHFEDEATDYTASILRRLNDDLAIVSALWPFEVANGLLFAERRGQITSVEVAEAVERTLALPIDVQAVSIEEALGAISDLARLHRLTAYDAAYLHLAIRQGLPLATLDDDLLVAARRIGLPELT